MKEVLKRGMLKFENSFFSHVVRCALGMIIPLVLTGGFPVLSVIFRSPRTRCF